MRGAINDTVGAAVVNNPSGTAGDAREAGGAVRSQGPEDPRRGEWHPLQHSCPEDLMDSGASRQGCKAAGQA